MPPIWIYLGRVPLIIAGQLLIADWSISAHLKYLMVCLGVSAFLLTFTDTASAIPSSEPC